ncbi:MAG: TetR/AcrR family transcriptional regulator [Rhodothermales bacterium]
MDVSSTKRKPVARRRPLERPDEILEAALEVFGTNGLASARMADIAERAGVAKGTVYLYFETKDELFRAVVRKTIGDAVAAMSEASVGDTARGRLQALMPALWDILRSPQFHTVYRLVYAELHHFPELTRFYSDEVAAGSLSSYIAEEIRQGIDEGEFRDVDPVVTARMLLALFVKHAVWLSRPDLFRHVASRSAEAVLNDITDFFFAALRRS